MFYHVLTTVILTCSVSHYIK